MCVQSLLTNPFRDWSCCILSGTDGTGGRRVKNIIHWNSNQNTAILLKKMKMSSANWRPFCLGLNVSMTAYNTENRYVSLFYGLRDYILTRGTTVQDLDIFICAKTGISSTAIDVTDCTGRGTVAWRKLVGYGVMAVGVLRREIAIAYCIVRLSTTIVSVSQVNDSISTVENNCNWYVILTYHIEGVWKIDRLIARGTHACV